jgi:hypothetical protein
MSYIRTGTAGKIFIMMAGIVCFSLLGLSTVSAQYLSDDGWKEFGSSYWSDS